MDVFFLETNRGKITVQKYLTTKMQDVETVIFCVFIKFSCLHVWYDDRLDQKFGCLNDYSLTEGNRLSELSFPIALRDGL